MPSKKKTKLEKLVVKAVCGPLTVGVTSPSSATSASPTVVTAFLAALSAIGSAEVSFGNAESSTYTAKSGKSGVHGAIDITSDTSIKSMD